MSLRERFDAKVERIPGVECHLWTAAVNAKGYGLLWSGDRLRSAHRLAYELSKGPIPEGQHVLHRCDTPGCVNPAHLFLGTDAENTADRVAKGRSARGERHGVSKLTAAQVAEIRASDETQRVLGQRYGVSRSLISLIKLGHLWTHV